MEVTKNFTGRIHKELLLVWGSAPGVEILDIPGEVDEVDAGMGE